MKQQIDIILASPRGFCAGVVRAIETVNLALQKGPVPVHVLHEIVHNRHVISELEERGARFVIELSEIPRGDICILSAHGVSVEIENRARELGLKTIDATCPLVTSIHRMVEKYHHQGFDVIIIGHHGHPEVEGTAGRVAKNVHVVADISEAETVAVRDPEKVAYVTQTTLSQEDIAGIRTVLEKRFAGITGPLTSNICYATQNRQNAVKFLAGKTDVIFVVGSKNSSNSNRLREVAENAGGKSYLIDDWRDIEPSWLIGVKSVGITAGASAPERLVNGVLEWLNENMAVNSITEMEGIEEKISFKPATI
ncbi:MAG: 4-hydroxy-3-methylbut-2-enyl diphosphate reductase [Desulfocapsaceae bacterium]|jgi:4-hydroxy-3-methylbut-2-enyl diphosphate reductase|nr:4-hydroxy-3-methylbut-2-enyl diphosphate reductase [Desulfocapsaceae bacterium]